MALTDDHCLDAFLQHNERGANSANLLTARSFYAFRRVPFFAVTTERRKYEMAPIPEDLLAAHVVAHCAALAQEQERHQDPKSGEAAKGRMEGEGGTLHSAAD